MENGKKARQNRKPNRPTLFFPTQLSLDGRCRCCRCCSLNTLSHLAYLLPSRLIDTEMIVPIHCPYVTTDNESDGPPEWAMIELNGELVIPTENGNDTDLSDEQRVEIQELLGGQGRAELGSLHYNNEVREREGGRGCVFVFVCVLVVGVCLLPNTDRIDISFFPLHRTNR